MQSNKFTVTKNYFIILNLHHPTDILNNSKVHWQSHNHKLVIRFKTVTQFCTIGLAELDIQDEYLFKFIDNVSTKKIHQIKLK